MNIEIQRKRGISYYYLAHSYRKLGKVRKVRVYLGRNLTKDELVKKRKNAEQQISERLSQIKAFKDPYKTVLAESEIEELKKLIPIGRIKLSHLSEDDWLKFTEDFVYDTNAIEGSTVEQKEVVGIIEKNEWPDKSKDEISETLGVADAVRYIRKTKEHISTQFIKELHKIVFKNSKPYAGIFRKLGEEVAVMDSNHNIIHKGAFSAQVPSLVRELIVWYEKNKRRYPPLVLAAVVHNQFENIHPFRDGNGRVGRLLLLNILLKHKLPPVNIELRNRTEYYSALQKYELEGNIRPTIELLLKEYRKLNKKFGV
ncbi:MAG: Fic family protein [Candidatus Micrarchaeota archaeon]|nr:Fic family protein [Candidatus Micrarchaeota archaeon]MDE1851852.1 Fic family protein [Candidatus Micrarchaeota archaeon]